MTFAVSFIENTLNIVEMLMYKLKEIVIISWIIDVSLSKKPRSKRQQEIWRVECEIGIISDPECPVDGGWSPWSPWSPCYGSCDQLGHQRRYRECNNPPPFEDGIMCSGEVEQIRSCYLTNCTVNDYKELIKGDAIRNDAFRHLETVPSLMERCLQTECPFEAIDVALNADNTWQLNAEALWNSLQCVKHNMGCPIIGEWSAWGTWSSCGARCGHGFRWRLRRCDAPPPSEALLICSGYPLQTDECVGDQCAIDIRNSNGAWGEWSPWTACSESCGIGLRRRRRSCLEMRTPISTSTWGTHCKGQHDELEMCENKKCSLNGGWSGWGPWGPCSQTCGAGRRSRSRSCTRPIPAGNGSPCMGQRTEIGSCHMLPCNAYTHVVALFNGDSSIQYNFANMHSTLFHFYIRFLPISPHGTLVRRGTLHGPYVRLSLQRWHICLDASGLAPSCSLPRICSHSVIEPAVWHSVLVTVTNEAATLRLDDSPVTLKNTFPCDPDLPNDEVKIIVGERFHGEVQELILNFMPLQLMSERYRRKSGFYPTGVTNLAYEKANMEEGYINLDNDQYIRIPCFLNQEEWRIGLTLKPRSEIGTILFLKNKMNWLHLSLQNMRLKLKLVLPNFHSECISSFECSSEQWLDIAVTKKRDANSIEAVLNSGERIHVTFQDIESSFVCRDANNKCKKPKQSTEGHLTDKIKVDSLLISLCTDEFFVGGVPKNINVLVSEEFPTFTGIVASITVDNILLDIHQLSIERNKNGIVQMSSRTASVSGSYHETSLGRSNQLNLTCLHARNVRNHNEADWFLLDTAIKDEMNGETVQFVDDSRLLKLFASMDSDLRGFYTCRARSNKRMQNIITYGVLGKIQYKLSGPDATTAVAVITTIALAIFTLGWLFMEGIHDLRDGYGFFRDAYLSPEEEADAVCEFIDQNKHLVGSASAVKIAKAKARRKARHLASRLSFGAQEPQGLLEHEVDEDNIPSEPEELPALPEIQSSIEASHNVLRCEPNYISSPGHGSFSSPRTKFTSTSSLEMTSPRVLCSRLLIAKRMHSPRKTSISNRKSITENVSNPRKTRSKLFTIKSSSGLQQSAAQKILQKFQELKRYDS
ncbi:uncharacterized protein LOC114245334 [Bombyx mandarina]|uniref:Uncharacterized protein LOC114245334 n=1 Tax=Bombyx mandarina TaxID=7092 RepID=A0A6J2JWN6_BOMMA|nr:uncharacterized protein LOC114245334 [Bombyx mandarina]